LTYGLTGGQISPESPDGTISPTAPFGNIEPQFDTAAISIAAGATFVARAIVSSPVQMDKVIKEAIQHKGFSVVEVFSNCHINWGRKNEHGDPFELIQWMKNELTTFSKAEADAENSTKKLLGVVHHDKNRREYTEMYYTDVVGKAKAKAAAKAAKGGN
jgi:2-oxoglutarate ferredoxin oxidoreductase subunit beta